MDISIRDANKKDIQAIINLGTNNYEFKVSDYVVDFWTREILEKVMNSENPLFVANKDEKIVGFIISNHNKFFGKAIIENIFVSDNYRKLGIREIQAESFSSGS